MATTPDQPPKRNRVLAIAYACHPEWGSENAVGWGWVTNIAKRHEVVVITADFNRSAIEKAVGSFSADNAPNITFAYVQNRWFHYQPNKFWGVVERSPFRILVNLVYANWQRDANALAKRLTRSTHFDLIHLITFVGFRFPGRFWALGLPFVWGPIGGLANTPWRLLPEMDPGGAAYYAFRNLANSLQRRFLRAPRLAARAANGGVIAATKEMQRLARIFLGVESTVISEVSPPDALPELRPQLRGATEAFRISWSGAHVSGKALPVLLKALQKLPGILDWRLDVLGDGPCRESWEKLASKLGIGERIVWLGSKPRNEAIERMQRSHVFVITSFKDLTSTVSVEALSLGLPIVCLDHCGYSEVVTPQCGIKVPLGPVDKMCTELAAALEYLATHEAVRRRMSAAALRRAEEFQWSAKLGIVDRVYATAMRSSCETAN